MDLKEFKRVFEGVRFDISDDYFRCDDSASYIAELELKDGYHLAFDMYGTHVCYQTDSGDWETPPEYYENTTLEIDEIVLMDYEENHIDVTPEIEEVIKEYCLNYFQAEEG